MSTFQPESLIPIPSHSEAEIVYVAVAEARGHLMRASQVCQMLNGEGLKVAPMVTGPRAKEFFEAASGMEAEELSMGYTHGYGPDHSIDINQSTTNILQYTFSAQGSRDLAAITRRMVGARVLLNDLSTTPCLAALGWMVGGPYLINVISENTYFALVNVDKLNSNRVKGAVGKKLLDAFFYAAKTNIINTMNPEKWFTREGVLDFVPPFTQVPERARPSECRWQGDAKGQKKLFVAYFNPEFRQKAFIGKLKETAARYDANLYLVSEYAADWHAELADERTQIVKQDFGMATLIREADLVITAAGLALPLQNYIAGTPQLIIANPAHIEHARNAETMRQNRMGYVIDGWDDVVEAAGKAMDQGQEAHPDIPARTMTAWRDIIFDLVDSPGLNLRGAMPVIRSFRQPLEAH